MNKEFIKAAVAAGVLIEVVSLVISWLTQSFFGYNMLSLPGMRPSSDLIGLLFFAYPFVLSFALAYAFVMLEKSFEGNYIVRGIKFGLLMWIIIAAPSSFLVFVSMNYPPGFIFNSLAGPFIYLPAGGVLMAMMLEKKN